MKDPKVVELEAALRHARQVAEQERAARRAAEESARRAWAIAMWGRRTAARLNDAGGVTFMRDN